MVLFTNHIIVYHIITRPNYISNKSAKNNELNSGKTLKNNVLNGSMRAAKLKLRSPAILVIYSNFECILEVHLMHIRFTAIQTINKLVHLENHLNHIS